MLLTFDHNLMIHREFDWRMRRWKILRLNLWPMVCWGERKKNENGTSHFGGKKYLCYVATLLSSIRRERAKRDRDEDESSTWYGTNNNVILIDIKCTAMTSMIQVYCISLRHKIYINFIMCVQVCVCAGVIHSLTVHHTLDLSTDRLLLLRFKRRRIKKKLRTIYNNLNGKWRKKYDWKSQRERRY